MWFRPSVAQEPKNLHELTLDPPTMDLRLHTNPELHYGVNGAASRSPRPGVSKVPPIQKSTGLRSSCSLTAPSNLKHHLHICERCSLDRLSFKWMVTLTRLHAGGVKCQLRSQNVSTPVRSSEGKQDAQLQPLLIIYGPHWLSQEKRRVSSQRRKTELSIKKKNWFVKTRWSS